MGEKIRNTSTILEEYSISTTDSPTCLHQELCDNDGCMPPLPSLPKTSYEHEPQSCEIQQHQPQADVPQSFEIESLSPETEPLSDETNVSQQVFNGSVLSKPPTSKQICRRIRNNYYLFYVVVLLVLTAIILGVLIGKQRNKEDESEITSEIHGMIPLFSTYSPSQSPHTPTLQHWNLVRRYVAEGYI